MQEHDARVFRGAAIPTAVVGLITTIVAVAMKGVPGLIGAVFGTLLVIAFFAVSFVVVCWAGRIGSHLLFPAAMGSYGTKIGVLGALLALLRDAGGIDSMAFGITVSIGTLVWVGAHARAMATDRRPIIEDAVSVEPESAGALPAGRRS